MRIACLWLAFALIGSVQANTPPRSVADIVGLAAKYSPDTTLFEQRRRLAETQPVSSATTHELRRFLLNRARAAQYVGRVHQGLDDLTSAKKLAPDWRDDLNHEITRDLSTAHLLTGDYAEGIRLLEELLSYSHAGRRIQRYVFLMSGAWLTGDTQKVKEHLGRAEKDFAELRSSFFFREFGDGWTGSVEMARSFMARVEGRHADQERHLRLALRHTILEVKKNASRDPARTYSREGGDSILIYIEWQLKEALIAQGKHVEAEWLLREQVKRIAAGAGSPLEFAVALNHFGQVLSAQRRRAEAITLMREANRVGTSMGVSDGSVYLLIGQIRFARLIAAEGRWDEAEQRFARIARIADGNPAIRRSISPEGVHWVKVQLVRGELEKARNTARRALERANLRFGEKSADSQIALAFSALADLKAGDLAASNALAAALRGIVLNRTYRESIVNGVGQQDLSVPFGWLVDGYLEWLGTQAAPSEDAIDLGLMLVEALRGSRVQQSLNESSARAAAREPELAELARREQDMRKRHQVLQETLSDLMSRPGINQLPATIQKMRSDIETLNVEGDRLRDDIAKRFPAYAELLNPTPAGVQAAQKMLRPGEAMLVTWGAEQRTFVWAIRANASRFAVVDAGSAWIGESVGKLRSAMNIAGATLESFPKFDVATAHALYAKLIQPVAPALEGADSLVVIPHARLGELPFAMLVTAPPSLPSGGTSAVLFAEYRAIPWLVRKMAVTQVPAVTTLASLRGGGARQASQGYAGFGDPWFRAEHAVANAAGPMRGFPVRNLDVGRLDAGGNPTLSNELKNLSRLPDTADEIREIARVLGAQDGDVFLGRDASETNAKKRALADKRVIVFATHGLVPGDLDGLRQPALALSNPEVTGEKDSDGLLAMDEVLELRLNAEWVVLSACNTAAADGAGTEALSGLGRAFFYAGARSLLVTNWPVETVSAKELTTDVFRRYVASPSLSRAQALRQAMLKVMDMDAAPELAGGARYAYAHPLFWAPYSLVGEGADR